MSWNAEYPEYAEFPPPYSGSSQNASSSPSHTPSYSLNSLAPPTQRDTRYDSYRSSGQSSMPSGPVPAFTTRRPDSSQPSSNRWGEPQYQTTQFSGSPTDIGSNSYQNNDPSAGSQIDQNSYTQPTEPSSDKISKDIKSDQDQAKTRTMSEYESRVAETDMQYRATVASQTTTNNDPNNRNKPSKSTGIEKVDPDFCAALCYFGCCCCLCEC